MIFHDPIRGEEREFDRSLRPTTFDEFVGQDAVRGNLGIAIAATRKREEPLDHVLLAGPPGLGKTTLAHLIAAALGTQIVVTSGPALAAPRDLMGTLTRLERGDVLFVDEIHRLPKVVEEYLYSAMEDHAIDVVLDPGPAGRSVRLTVAPFTLVGATTREGLLTAAFRSRFGLVERLEPYPPANLRDIVERAAARLGVSIRGDAAQVLAERARGTPRMALRLLRRTRDLAQIEELEALDRDVAERALARLQIDHLGLDAMDRKILEALTRRRDPVGLKTLAAIVQEAEDTLEDVFEPHLIRLGLMSRTPRGRIATAEAFDHLGATRPEAPPGALPFDAPPPPA